MAHERKCMMCGTEYKYCSHCNDFDPTESWKYLYHDKKCRAIANIWYAYRGNEISKEDAKARMSEFKPNIDDVLKYTSIAANEIRDIFGIKKEDVIVDEADNVVVDNVVENIEVNKAESKEDDKQNERSPKMTAASYDNKYKHKK